MDPVAAVTFEIGQLQQPTAVAQQQGNGGQVTVFDVAQFEAIQQQTQVQQQSSSIAVEKTQAMEATVENNGFQQAAKMIESLNGRMEGLGVEALRFAAEQKELTPAEMLKITVHSHQFLFQSELTANVANRTSEGIQQLFRQQS